MPFAKQRDLKGTNNSVLHLLFSLPPLSYLMSIVVHSWPWEPMVEELSQHVFMIARNTTDLQSVNIPRTIGILRDGLFFITNWCRKKNGCPEICFLQICRKYRNTEELIYGKHTVNSTFAYQKTGGVTNQATRQMVHLIGNEAAWAIDHRSTAFPGAAAKFFIHD